MPGDCLKTHVAAQTADHAAEAAGETTTLIYELTVLHASFVLADEDLRQLNLDHTRVAQ